MKKLKQWSKKAIAYLEGFVSIVANILLFAAKLTVGILFHSIAMIADAWHTLSDSLTSLVVIMGFWISGKPADKEHPFGHGRAEIIATIIIGTLLAVVGFNFLSESVQRLINREVGQFSAAAIVVFSISLVLKEGLSRLSLYLGRIIDSSALKADAWHHRTDAIASGLIVIGAFISPYAWWVDGVLGIIVSFLIVFSAMQILVENASSLLGKELTQKIKNNIKDLIFGVSDEITDVHHFHYHDYGEHKELTFHIRVSSRMQVDAAHKLVNQIEREIRKKYGFETTIHIEPEGKTIFKRK